MPKRVFPSVSPSTGLAVFAAGKVGSGRCGSASEVVRMVLRSPQGKEQAPPRRRAGAGVENVPGGR